ncbi:putative bifunctional diguanylate cyclase/phosphodiesterase [Cereibacter ovatus]|uniref:putative bifunctional diguanylate cyclase/phosphodiesterase n=1 Tax=Cereibacter ovatus TaxID=439529 RepID=UPI001F2B404F|nr:GGDEF domain-containing phosphodiesterase [Cereibacter ovatus]
MTGKGQRGTWVQPAEDLTAYGKLHASRAMAELLDITETLLRAPATGITRAIRLALARAATVCGADRALLCAAGPDGGLRTIHDWMRKGLSRRRMALIGGATDWAGDWAPILFAGRTVVLHPGAAAPGDRAAAPLAAAGLQTLVAVPIPDDAGRPGCLTLCWTGAARIAAEDLPPLRPLAAALLAALARREATRALADGRTLLRSILQTGTSAVLAFDGARRIVFANPEAAALLGSPAETLPGKTLDAIGCRLLTAEGAPIADADRPVDCVLANGQPMCGQHVVLACADGRHRILNVNATPVATTSAGGVQVVATLDDVTGQVSTDSALRSALAEAHQLAYFDPLTGYYNRRGIVEVLRDCLHGCGSGGTHLALLYIDIDGMRQVNGGRGHWMGDRLLEAVARRLDGLRLDGGDLGRISADEFVLTLAEPQPDAATAVKAAEAQAEAILAALREPFRLDGLTLEITVSIGLAAISAGTTVEALLKGGELAVMAAKAGGGNRACAYRPDMEQDMVGRVALTQDLREALRRNEFRIHFEPMVRLDATGLHIVGHEALIRWQHPTRGMVPPNAFIPFAEGSGFIRDIDLWVLRRAAAELARWTPDPARRHLTLSINISSASFLSPGFAQAVRDLLAETGADPRRIELEVTEGTLLTNLGAARTTMSELRTMGLSIALDDFGTGFSSLSYLRDLPVDVLKIDRSFLSALSEADANMTILEGIIGLARGLGVEMVAEGVETPAQFEWLRAKGCQTFQGYLFGRPQPAPQLALPPEILALGGLDAVAPAAGAGRHNHPPLANG